MKILTTAACAALLCSAAHAQSADPLAPTGRWTAYAAGRAATPPMGWNSWNAFASAVDEEKVMGSAKRIVDSGLARKGYVYVNLDDGWAAGRRQPDGHLMIRADKFPSTRGLTRRRRRSNRTDVARHGPQGWHLLRHGPQHCAQSGRHG
jgi:hypothetical protein